MNFSNRLTGLLYISSFPSLFRPGLNVPGFSFEFQRFNLFYSVNKLRLVTPVLFGIAKVEIFLVLSSFLLNFFSFVLLAFFKRLKRNNNNTLFYFQQFKNNLLFISFTVSLPPKRDAKVRKLQTQTNISLLYIYNPTLTPYLSTRKTDHYF